MTQGNAKPPGNYATYRARVLRVPPRQVIISVRQAQCLDSLCDGMTYAEIGARLDISSQAVKTHLKRLYRAVGADNQAHALGLVLTGRVTVLVNDPSGMRAA